ncbi:MAG: AAA family ATPase, partial [Candidatus Methanofastidiosia archaeon]
MDEVILNVADTEKIDVGRHVARLCSSLMEAMGLEAGDTIEIKGARSIPAIVWRGRFEDEGKRIIRMDPILRMSAGVSLGDRVKVLKIQTQDALSIVLAPAEDKYQFSGDLPSYFRQKLLSKPLSKNNIVLLEIFNTVIPFIVTKTNPKGFVTVTERTEIMVSEKPQKLSDFTSVPEITYEDIGGLRDEIQKVREMIELPMKHPEVFEKLGIAPPKGVLLYGPPGCGKTLLAKALANEINATFLVINGPEIMSKYYGQSEENLRKIFEEAEKKKPSLIFIDEIDAI